MEVFKLKVCFLLEANSFMCPYCEARLFVWTKRAGFSGVVGLVNTTSSVSLGSRLFFIGTLKNSWAYNNLFSFSALGVTMGFPAPPSSSLKIQGRGYHYIFDLNYSESANDCALYIDGGAERLRLATARRDKVHCSLPRGGKPGGGGSMLS